MVRARAKRSRAKAGSPVRVGSMGCCEHLLYISAAAHFLNELLNEPDEAPPLMCLLDMVRAPCEVSWSWGAAATATDCRFAALVGNESSGEGPPGEVSRTRESAFLRGKRRGGAREWCREATVSGKGHGPGGEAASRRSASRRARERQSRDAKPSSRATN